MNASQLRETVEFSSPESVEHVMGVGNMQEGGIEGGKGREGGRCALDQDSLASRVDVTLYAVHMLALNKGGFVSSPQTVTYFIRNYPRPDCAELFNRSLLIYSYMG